MSPLLWLQRLFVPRDEEGNAEDGNSGESGVVDVNESPFVFNQHMRIVAAIIVTFVGAIVVWWILA